MALMEVGLDDKYRLDAKRIFLSRTQALVRLPMLLRTHTLSVRRSHSARPLHVHE